MGKRRSGRYVMTSRRRRALEKAQQVSARNRRRRNRRVAVGVGATAGILGVVGISAYAMGRNKKANVVSQTTSTVSTIAKVEPVRKVTYLPPNAGVRGQAGRINKVPGLPLASRYLKGPIRKQKLKAELKRKKRERYNYDRRRAYWGRKGIAKWHRPSHIPKKVGGNKRKNAAKTPEQRVKEHRSNRKRGVNPKTQVVSLFVAKQKKLMPPKPQKAIGARANNVVSLDSKRKPK